MAPGSTGPPDRYGHDGVHTAVSEFCAAWTIGVDALCDRARRNGRSLTEVAQAYRDAERHAVRALTVDPGSGVVDPPAPPPR